MNTKNNNRARETRGKIDEALVRLLEKKGFGQITVSELCDLCGINRSTFYRHYRDIYDLAERLQENMMADALAAYFQPVGEGCLPFSRKCFESLFAFVLAHLDYYAGVIAHSENVKIVDFTRRRSDALDMAPLLQTARLESSNEEHFRMAYFDGGLNAVIRCWVRGGAQVTPKELSYFMEKEYQYEVAEIEAAARRRL